MLFLLLGAIVNVAVAWGITAHAEFNEPALRKVQVTIEDSEWPRAVPQHWPPLRTAWDAHPFGWRVKRFIGRRYNEDRTTGQWGSSEHFFVDIYEVGWPSGSLQWETWLDFTIDYAQNTPTYRFEGQPARTWWRSGIPVSAQRFGFGPQSWKALPIHPVYFGFAINTVFYAATLWLAIPGSFALRRFVRRKRGHCIKCGYDLRGASGGEGVCPECGASGRSPGALLDGKWL